MNGVNADVSDSEEDHNLVSEIGAEKFNGGEAAAHSSPNTAAVPASGTRSGALAGSLGMEEEILGATTNELTPAHEAPTATFSLPSLLTTPRPAEALPSIDIPQEPEPLLARQPLSSPYLVKKPADCSNTSSVGLDLDNPDQGFLDFAGRLVGCGSSPPRTRPRPPAPLYLLIPANKVAPGVPAGGAEFRETLSAKFLRPGYASFHVHARARSGSDDWGLGSLLSPQLRRSRSAPGTPEMEQPSLLGGADLGGAAVENDHAVNGGPGADFSAAAFGKALNGFAAFGMPQPPKMETWEERRDKRDTDVSEVEIMKERFAKLLLGEDMSGGSKGVCQALAISNAITNLSASVFGEKWKLAPLSDVKKFFWRREMEWLLCVSDYIVEMVPGIHINADGIPREVMITRQRADLQSGLPALRKLDGMLQSVLDGFTGIEWTYSDPKARMGGDEDDLDDTHHRNQDKWWLPVPLVPDGGLSADGRVKLLHQREVAQQILKASMAINAQVLYEMDIPDAYVDTLPKTGHVALGDELYKQITGEHFNSDRLLSKVDLTSEHTALEVANKLESAIHTWRRKVFSHKTPLRDPKARGVRDRMHDFLGDITKMEEHARKAESTLLQLRVRCPGLPQTALDTCKIQYNRDVGKAILECYARVLESLASNIVSRVEDVLYQDDLAKNPDARSSKFFDQRFSPLQIPTLFSDVHRDEAAGGGGGGESAVGGVGSRSGGHMSPPESSEPGSMSPQGSTIGSPQSAVSPTPTSPLSLRSDGSSTFGAGMRNFFRKKPPGLPRAPYADSVLAGISSRRHSYDPREAERPGGAAAGAGGAPGAVAPDGKVPRRKSLDKDSSKVGGVGASPWKAASEVSSAPASLRIKTGGHGQSLSDVTESMELAHSLGEPLRAKDDLEILRGAGTSDEFKRVMASESEED